MAAICNFERALLQKKREILTFAKNVWETVRNALESVEYLFCDTSYADVTLGIAHSRWITMFCCQNVHRYMKNIQHKHFISKIREVNLSDDLYYHPFEASKSNDVDFVT